MKRIRVPALFLSLLLGLPLPPSALAAEERGDPITWQIGYGENGKRGYLDQNGDWAIAPRFDTAYEFDETGHAIVEMQRDGGDAYSGYLYGIIDATGAYTAEPVYPDIWTGHYYGGGRTFQWEDGSYGIMEADGSIRVSQVQGVDYLSGFTCSVAEYRLGEKWGLMDAQGNKLTDALYDNVYVRDAGWVEIRNGEKCGVMALDGRVVIPPSYDYLSDDNISRTDLIGVYLDEKFGLASMETGKLVLPCVFNSTDEANVALALGVTSREEIHPACIKRCGELGLSVMWLEPEIKIMRKPGVDRMVLLKGSLAAIYGLDGTPYTDYSFDVVRDFDGQGRAVVLKNGKWGQIDLNGNTVVDFIYDDEEEAKAGIQVHFVSQWADDSPPYALAKRDGTVLTEYKYWSCTPFSNGFAMVADGENWAYLDADGKELTPFKYMPMGSQFGSTPFGEDGFAIVQVREDRRRNIIDSTGRELLPENYYKVWRAGCGLFGVQMSSGVGFIDGTGKVAIEPQYDYYTDPKGFMKGNTFDEKTGLASVWSKGVWITIDAQGNRVTEPQTAEDVNYQEGLTPANYYGPGNGWSGGPWGFQNEKGEWVVPQMFDAVGEFDRGYATVRSAGYYGLLKNPLLENEDAHRVSDWAAAEVTAATQAGYVTEDCKAYQTYTITREQFASLAVNYLEKKTGQSVAPAPVDTFTDAAGEAVRKAYAAGIVQGVGESRFDPDGLLNREQLATMLWRAMEKVGAGMHIGSLDQYTDADQISDWAGNAMNNLVHHEIMAGTGPNTLSPKASCTVEQAILLVYRAARKEYTLPSEQEAWRQAAIGRVTIEGLKIGTPFDELPRELRTALQFQGETDDYAPIPDKEICKRYTAPGIEIVTSTVLDQVAENWFRENASDEELQELFSTTDGQAALAQVLGREYVEAVTLTDDTFHMASGLKVGDSEERVKELGYSLNGEGRYSEVMYSLGSTYIDLEGSKVARIQVHDSIGRRVGPFFDP